MGRVKGAGNEVFDSKTNEASRESMDGEPFDTRPVYPDELKAKYRAFHAVANFFRYIYSSLVDGVRNAFSAILYAFDSADAASTALRHIKEEVAVPPSTQGTLTSSHPSMVKQEEQAEIVEAAEVAALAGPPVDADAVDFSHYLSTYKRDQAKGVDTVCPQNFEKGATQFAQKIFDSEVKRCAEFADRPKEYSLPADDQLKIKAAAALLHKKVPHPVPLKFAEVREVATHSADEFGSFLAWRELRNNGKLPEAGSIDLEAAINYANAYIAKHVKPEYLENEQVQLELKSAYDLISKQSDYAQKIVDIQFQNILNDVDEIENHKKPPPPPPPPRVSANKPPAPPPPRIQQNGPPQAPPARTGAANTSFDTEAIAAASALSLQQADIALLASLVIPQIDSPKRDQIVFNAMPFLERLNDGRFNPVLAEAALSLAQYWNSAKNSPDTLKQLQVLPSFKILDKLLDIKMITAQMPPEN